MNCVKHREGRATGPEGYYTVIHTVLAVQVERQWHEQIKISRQRKTGCSSKQWSLPNMKPIKVLIENKKLEANNCGVWSSPNVTVVLLCVEKLNVNKTSHMSGHAHAHAHIRFCIWLPVFLCKKILKLTPSWTKAFHVCSSFLISLQNQRKAQFNTVTLNMSCIYSKGQRQLYIYATCLQAEDLKCIVWGDCYFSAWVNSMYIECCTCVITWLLRWSPVGLQDVDDSDVEKKSLSSSIHSRDTTHPKVRRKMNVCAFRCY